MAAGENVFDCRSVVWGPQLQVSRVWRVGEQAEGGGCCFNETLWMLLVALRVRARG